MAVYYDTPNPRQYSFLERVKIILVKNSPDFIGKLIQLAMIAFVKLFRFIGSLFHEALGR